MTRPLPLWAAVFALALFYAAILGLSAFVTIQNALILLLPGLLFVVVSGLTVRLAVGRVWAVDLALVPGRRMVATVLAGAFILNAAVVIWENMNDAALDAAQDFAQSLGLGQSVRHDLLVIFAVTVLAPVGEELFFRGVIFRALRDGLARWLPNWVALILGVAVSSYVFAMGHDGEGQDVQFYAILMMGAFLALSLHLSGSLFVPIMIHTINNTLAAIQGFWADPTVTLAEPWLGPVILLGPLVTWGLMRLRV